MVAAGTAPPVNNIRKQAVKKKGKKRKISKHIADAATKPSPRYDETTALPVTDAPAAALATKKYPSTKKKGATNKLHVKDPSEAAAYLTGWKRRAAAAAMTTTTTTTSKSSGHNWKFNKNTQSWIIRYLYEVDKISKIVFADAVDYLVAAGDTVKERIVADATARALRYQQHCSSRSNSEKGAGAAEIEGSPTSLAVTTTISDDAAAAAAKTEVDETTRWTKLSDHDKRKEYKRARKVLDALAVVVTATPTSRTES